MTRKFIPIIGPISAGKSTFLRAFLGIELLETGSFVTTKFVCIIKYSNRLSFSHLIPNPNNQGGELFIRDGAEITDSNQIMKRIEELNEKFRDNRGTRKEIFYLLETPIKNISNKTLLENVYFMDIPGLNENNSNYIEEIFSVIKMEHILFEIMIFDSNDSSSDKINKIFEKLEKKHCLKKNDNLYILNKMDERTAGEEPERLIENFRKVFYYKFEKNENQQSKDNTTGYTGIAINSYKNYFVPMNSLLYEAETKYETDFFSALLTEYFYYSELKDKYDKLYNFIEDKINNIFKDNNDSLKDIEKEIKQINPNSDDMKIINKSISKLEEINNVKTYRINLGFNIKIPKILNNIKKYYLLYKKKLLFQYFIPSESYFTLQNIINDINPLEFNSGCAPTAASSILKVEKEKDDPILQEIFDFIKNNLKHKFKDLNNNLSALSQFILGRKIRIVFIGNISVGKSTVLNTLIGEEILPTKDMECTYRGIIIKHKDIDNFELYRTNMVEIAPDTGDTAFISFQPEKEPYCKTKEAINYYLKNKNSDRKEIGNKDAFITIQGRLKIFDYIKLNQKLIDKIEFLDLPGHDNESNPFNQKYNSIALRFSNISIYISDSQNVLDDDSIAKMKKQYLFVKGNLHPTLKNKCFNTSLFLINKSDKLSKENEKKKIKEDLFKLISKLDENANINRMNYACFSGKFFMEYLNAYKIYVDLPEKNPKKFFELIYEEWTSKIWKKLFPWSSFSDYLIEKIYDVGEKFKLDLTIYDNTKIPSNFYQNVEAAFCQLYKNKKKKIDNSQIEEIIRPIFCLKEALKYTDFSKTEYSREFFYTLKNVIEQSEQISKEDIELKIETFFLASDKLFNRKLEEETEEIKKENQRQLRLYEDKIIPNIEKILKGKKETIRNIIEEYKQKCIDIIDDEITNYEARLKTYKYEIKDAAKQLEDKIKNKITEMKNKQEEETNTIIKDIEKETKDIINNYYKSKDIEIPNIQQEKETTLQKFISIFTSVVSNIATMTGIIVGSALGVGGAVASASAIGAFLTTSLGFAFGLLGIGLGVAIGFLVSWLWSKSRTKEQYHDALEKNKQSLKDNFAKIENSFSNDYDVFYQTLLKEMRAHVSALYEEINFDNSKWKAMKEEYKKQKENIRLKLKNRKKIYE